jgi:alkanesulfonate monooxygenase SsuD/methylene tetrahydromethanopterin reductase-like flavin-dependent oxidoreductase (luciferase family)
LKVGVFDHLDRSSAPLQQQYEDRLRLIAAYDEAGIETYHLAEHHATPLGMSPSPGVFLSAVAQRTKRLRFGPLVYPLVLYHPLRLLEEICMLDHLSGGRLEFGLGRGASPHELRIYGVDPELLAPTAYSEALTVLMAGLDKNADALNFEGEIFKFKDVPLVMRPLQQPHPPMWYGASRVDRAAWAAQNDLNIVVNQPADRAKAIFDRYYEEWTRGGKRLSEAPKLGINRFVVIAPTETRAMEIASRAYKHWSSNFWKLWDMRGGRPYAYYPDTFEEAQSAGFGVAGTARKVLETLLNEVAACRSNYLVCRFAFGDLTFAESMHSLELFSRDVLPHLEAHRTAESRR